MHARGRAKEGQIDICMGYDAHVSEACYGVGYDAHVSGACYGVGHDAHVSEACRVCK